MVDCGEKRRKRFLRFHDIFLHSVSHSHRKFNPLLSYFAREKKNIFSSFFPCVDRIEMRFLISHSWMRKKRTETNRTVSMISLGALFTVSSSCRHFAHCSQFKQAQITNKFISFLINIHVSDIFPFNFSSCEFRAQHKMANI